MAESEIIPYTEDELYVVPRKESNSAPSKVIPIHGGNGQASSADAYPPLRVPADMKLTKSTMKTANTFLKDNKTLIWMTALIIVAVGIYFYWHHQRQLKDKKEVR